MFGFTLQFPVTRTQSSNVILPKEINSKVGIAPLSVLGTWEPCDADVCEAHTQNSCIADTVFCVL